MIVYLLHFPSATDQQGMGHYLGTAANEAAINLRHVPHGRGWRTMNGRRAAPVVADVWDVTDAAEQDELYHRLKRQGSRKRLCSICNPGNARGAGRGNWERRTEVEEDAR